MSTLKIQTVKNRVVAVLAAFVWASLTLSPVYASDTEVYSRTVEATGAGAPVLMMVLDTSDDMNKCMTSSSVCTDSTSGVAGSRDEDSRVATLGRVMQKALFGNPLIASGPIIKPAPGYLHMGYARYNPKANDGGWMRYPAKKNLDALTAATTAEVLAAYTNVKATFKVAGGTADGSVTSLTGTSFVLGGVSSVGVHFANVTVPLGATITEAKLSFTKTSNGNSSFTIKVAPQVGETLPFTDTADLTARVAAANSSFRKTTYNNGVIDVQTEVQDIVSGGSSAWCGGSGLTLLLADGDSTNTVYSSEGNSGTTPPTLTVKYSMPDAASLTSSCTKVDRDVVMGLTDGLDDIEWNTGATKFVDNYNGTELRPATADKNVGVRFPGVQITQGATITEAWLYATGSGDSDPLPVAPAPAVSPKTILVQAFDVGDVGTFCDRDATTKVVTCPAPAPSSLAVLTTAAPGGRLTLNPYTNNAGVNYVVDVKDQVKAIVDRPDWASGNAMGFRLRNESSAAADSSATALTSANASRSGAMMLHIKASQTVKDLTAASKTVRQDLAEDISERLLAIGGTPLGDTYAEAARYMLGMESYEHNTVDYFGTPYPQPDPRTVTGALGPNSKPVYDSPISPAAKCSANYVYMLSDAEPKDASNVGNNSKGVTGGVTPANPSCAAYNAVSTGTANLNFSCMQSVSYHMATGKNQLQTATSKTKILTNTVLFGPAPAANMVADLKSIAEGPDVSNPLGGHFYEAQNEAELLNSLLDTLRSLVDRNGSITAPGVAVNQFNRLTHLDQLYYAVFDPEPNHLRWLGNVKRYRLAYETATVTNPDGTTSIVPTAVIKDFKGLPAVDEGNTGLFKTTATSWWTSFADGDNAALGGAANVIPTPLQRTLYTVTGASPSTTLVKLKASNATPTMSAADITAGASLLQQPSNLALTTTQFKNLVNWRLGYDIDIVQESPAPATISNTLVTPTATTLYRKQVGGVLHSKPVVVSYALDGTNPENDALQDNMVFFSDMEGLLHAISTKTGVEQFAFLPQELLQKQAALAINGVPNGLPKLPEFGLDSTWTVWREDGNKDFAIAANGAGGDKVWLFGGMRMGGSSYYALDVTDRTDPKLKWVKGAASGGAYANIGETWSQPVLGNVKVNGVVKKVMFMAGGYARDRSHELAGLTDPTLPTTGNQIYIVDPDTGNVMWWASGTGSGANTVVPEMRYSIPSDVKTFDANQDGLVDAVYVGDLGGQVFRVDINNLNTTASGSGLASATNGVKVFATIGQEITADIANQRRFYDPPSVARLLGTDKRPYVVVAMGSGYRSLPLDTSTEEEFYVFKDNDVLKANVASLTSTDLQATIKPVHLALVDTADESSVVDITSTMGWRMPLLDEGEKVLGSPLISLNDVIFTSYIPPSLSTDECQPIGQSRLWKVGVVDAKSAFVHSDGTIGRSEIASEGMLNGAFVHIGEDGQNAIVAGTKVVRRQDLGAPNMRRIRWYEKLKK